MLIMTMITVKETKLNDRSSYRTRILQKRTRRKIDLAPDSRHNFISRAKVFEAGTKSYDLSIGSRAIFLRNSIDISLGRWKAT